MTRQPPIADMTVADLVAAIAADRPAPGAGVAGSVALALGLGCLRKALRITARHHPADAPAGPSDASLAAAGLAALEHGRLDASRFAALIEAVRLPHGEEDQAAARTAAIDQATAALAANTARLLEICDDARAWLASASDHVDTAMSGDIAAARALIGAARTINRANLAEAEGRDG